MREQKTVFQKILFYNSPTGLLRLEASDNGLRSVSFIDPQDAFSHEQAQLTKNTSEMPEILIMAKQQLNDYFKGHLKNFYLKLDLSGLKDFSRRVLEQTSLISWGDVITYGNLAEKIGAPQSVRAVGGALARNPLPIIIPCHRVLASNGHLNGYSGMGGLLTKAWLLELEGHIIKDNRLV